MSGLRFFLHIDGAAVSKTVMLLTITLEFQQASHFLCFAFHELGKEKLKAEGILPICIR